MRYILILLLIFKLNSCFGQDYFIETKHFDCLENSFSELGLDLKGELLEFEEHLIKNGVLTDKSGESYFHIYQTIAETGDINFKFNYSFLDSIKPNNDDIEIHDFNSDCIKIADKLKKSKKFKKSKIYQLNTAMDSIQISGYINVSAVANVILDILTPHDFENDYYKMTALLLLATTQDTDSGILKGLPSTPKTMDTIPVKSRNMIIIKISTDNDSVSFNGERCAIADLTKLTKTFILSTPNDSTMPELKSINIDLIGDCLQSKAIISLQNERETLYKTYVTVQQQLTEAYSLARNDKSLEIFELDYEMLSNQQQDAINELIPMRISEAEPTQ